MSISMLIKRRAKSTNFLPEPAFGESNCCCERIKVVFHQSYIFYLIARPFQFFGWYIFHSAHRVPETDNSSLQQPFLKIFSFPLK